MRKLIGFVFGLFGKLLLLALVILLFGALYAGAYFYQKSGETMTVAESQQRAPGLTFRDFWTSRVTQWEASNDELEKAGVRRYCGVFKSSAIILGWALSPINVAQARNTASYNNINNIPDEILYNAPFLDANWSYIEHGTWRLIGSDPGYPEKELSQRRACTLTYPTPVDVTANQPEASTLP